MSSQIVGVEANGTNGDLGLVRVYGAVGLGEAVRLQHVEQCCLARIIQSQENNFGRFLEETHPFESTLEIIENEHISLLINLSPHHFFLSE